ncbi:MAG: helix-turn-helix domain-containing protein [Actinomycetes bacterium]
MIVLRQHLGDELRRQRQQQGRTLRQVSASARVSLGYLSEIERGQKEASSELLASICGALEVPLSQVLRNVGDDIALAELAATVTSDGAARGRDVPGRDSRRPEDGDSRTTPGVPAAV